MGSGLRLPIVRLCTREGMSTDLRTSLIRLAHTNESLRPHLLPILRDASFVGGVPRCDMEQECLDPVTHLDEKGYVYCTKHGVQRSNWSSIRCRKLRPAEVKMLGRGKQIFRFASGKEAHRLDGVRRHVLMPAAIRAKIPPIRGQESEDDPIVWVKYFSPYTNALWLVTEFDGSDEMFGWADLGMGGGELGYISLSELEGLERRGLPLVERDTSWRPMPLSKAKRD